MRIEFVNEMSGQRPLIAAILMGAALMACATDTQPTSKPIANWDASNEANAERIEHGSWQSLLNRYLHVHRSGINRFDYAALKANAKDTSRLANYLAQLQRLDPRDYSRAEQKAYWINLYNALTVQVVLEAYPVNSIRDISGSFLGGLIVPGPWDDAIAHVAGLDLSLDDIEHGILRPIYRDNRIHYGANCASLGCPNLLPTAFTGANTETLLDSGAREYVNHPRGVAFIDDDSIVISSIYDWYVEDFGGTEEGAIKHLIQYADQELAERLRGFEGTVEYDYDWGLNQP